MPQDLYSELTQLRETGSREELVDQLIDRLSRENRLHQLFDARMLKRKLELGLPLSRPASLADVPQELRKEVEKTYIEAARDVAQRFIEQGDLANAWMYLQVIREPGALREALESRPIPDLSDDETEQLIRIALYEGVHPVRGIQMMLKLHGTCSTITALDQSFGNLPQEERQACARLMVRELYNDLRSNVEREVQQKLAMLPPGESLRSLIAPRDWLFEGGNYHIDVSHLNAVVRFARSIESGEELELALQLAEYGSRLDPQLQYGGDPPFEDFYPAHIQFFRAILDIDRQEALDYFREKLEAEPDESDKPLLAYVLVDLLVRVGQLDEAVDVSAQWLTNLSEDMTFSFVELCQKAGRSETLRNVLKEKDDPVGFVAALIATEPVQESTT